MQFPNASVAVTNTGSIPTIPRRAGLQVNVSGTGMCDQMTLHFGDDSAPITLSQVDLSDNFPDSQHAYGGFGGRKTVAVEGASPNCTGTVEKLIVVTPEIFEVGFAPSSAICGVVQPEVLRRNTIVNITSPANDPVRRVDFCPPLSGRCSYDANGTGQPAGPGFPFPNLSKFSLVLRVGSQVIQGGTDVTFVTTGSGALELCMNMANFADSLGGAWLVVIDVDESRAAR